MSNTPEGETDFYRQLCGGKDIPETPEEWRAAVEQAMRTAVATAMDKMSQPLTPAVGYAEMGLLAETNSALNDTIATLNQWRAAATGGSLVPEYNPAIRRFEIKPIPPQITT